MLEPDSLISVFLFAFTVSIGAVVSPGPVSAAIVTEAPRQGWRVGPLVAAGHVGLELVIVLLISLGLNSQLATPAVTRVIALAGGMVLILMGGSYLRAVFGGSISLPDPDEEPVGRSTWSLLSLGVATTLTNPFWYAWWVTVAAGYLSQSERVGLLAGPLIFYLGHISADLSWDSALAYATSAGGRWLNDRSYRALTVVTGVFMLYLGAVFIRSGLSV